jgi:hypothetical protein
MINETLWRLKPMQLKDKNLDLEALGFETRDQKLIEGEKYIERLKAEGQNVVKVINDGEFLRIYTE